MTIDLITDAQHCPACGAANDCAIAPGAAQCWCMAEPIAAVQPSANATSCYCRHCLQQLRLGTIQPLQKPTLPR